MPFFNIHYFSFICDKCGKNEKLHVNSGKGARKYGWAISKDYKKCYCPDCADKMRSKGMKGKH